MTPGLHPNPALCPFLPTSGSPVGGHAPVVSVIDDRWYISFLSGPRRYRTPGLPPSSSPGGISIVRRAMSALGRAVTLLVRIFSRLFLLLVRAASCFSRDPPTPGPPRDPLLLIPAKGLAERIRRGEVSSPGPRVT